MKPFRERFGKQYRSKRLKNENTFTVKYLGSATKLAKDKKVVENAVNQLTDRALSKDISYQLLRKNYIHVTENRVALFPKGKQNEGSEIFSIPIAKMSYGFFPPKRDYQILALNRHVSKNEVETYVVCCKSKDKMLAIKMAFYSTFKGRYLAKLRRKRIENNVLSNQYFSHQHYSREDAENPPKRMQNGRPPALSNDVINEYPKEETVVEIHHQEQRRKQVETAGSQNNFVMVTVRPTPKIASGVYKDQSALKVDRHLKSSMC